MVTANADWCIYRNCFCSIEPALFPSIDGKELCCRGTSQVLEYICSSKIDADQLQYADSPVAQQRFGQVVHTMTLHAGQEKMLPLPLRIYLLPINTQRPHSV